MGFIEMIQMLINLAKIYEFLTESGIIEKLHGLFEKRIPETTVKTNPHIRQNIDHIVFNKCNVVILWQKSHTEVSGIITFLI